MGIQRNGGQERLKPANEITEKEAAFIVAKLRQATYQGSEFEQFYGVMSKLQSIIGKKDE